jgi:hypothetical protein
VAALARAQPGVDACEDPGLGLITYPQEIIMKRILPSSVALASAALMTAAALMAATGSQAAEPVFKPLYVGVPKASAQARTVHSEGKGVFLENIVALPGGSFAITSLFDGRILRMKGDHVSPWVTVPGHASGIESDGAGGVYVGGWAQDERHLQWHVSAESVVSESTPLPDAALPNGITWPLNHFVRIAVRPDGTPGAAEMHVRDVFADDFVIDRQGRIFATTHAYNSVIRIDADGQVHQLGARDEGLQGATAVALDNTRPGATQLVALTNGGVYVPPAWGVEDAKVERLVVKP